MATPTVPVLPPGVSAGTLERALHRLSQLVGAEHVLTGDGLAGHADPYAFNDTRACAPSAAVLPASVEQVQAVLAVANEHRIPVWTVSRGRNYGYGGASPRVGGSIILDLSRMNRVLQVDEESAFALVEPGVSFADLHQHLRDIGSSLWISVPDLSWGSLVGNALERGFGYMVGGDHSAQVCGMEVVLADGRVVRTGMGAMTDNPAWQMYKGGFGTLLDGLFLQSNYGVVTKMGIWLAPQPEQAVVCAVKAPDEGDLAPLMDTLRPLLLDGTIQSTSMVGNALAIASMITDRNLWYDGPGPMPDDVVRTLCDKLGIGWWHSRFGLYGPKELTEARLTVVRRAFERIPGVEVTSRAYDGSFVLDEVHPADRAPLGVPSTDLIRMAGWRGGEPAHTDFSLVCPPKGADAVRQMQLIRRRIEEYGFDYAGGFTTFSRHAIALALISFDKSDPAQRATVGELFPRLIADAAGAGYASYRAHVDFMDLIDQYEWGDQGHVFSVSVRARPALAAAKKASRAPGPRARRQRGCPPAAGAPGAVPRCRRAARAGRVPRHPVYAARARAHARLPRRRSARRHP